MKSDARTKPLKTQGKIALGPLIEYKRAACLAAAGRASVPALVARARPPAFAPAPAPAGRGRGGPGRRAQDMPPAPTPFSLPGRPAGRGAAGNGGALSGVGGAR